MNPLSSPLTALLVVNLLSFGPALAAINLVALTSDPINSGSVDDSAARVITPPAGIPAGDLSVRCVPPLLAIAPNEHIGLVYNKGKYHD